ncbi:CobW family GTP-binding protein [Marinilabilia rubra]|uniref:CobW/HypB/UreG nucleotide-binding domain-containing protein n=1 Tax=Marinilabilia rubra TaxID=2162893 RepID=A0A2U2BC02_9BACT|nr:CobW family GTP-binding protein [Marinilabilia rubra]PWE00602.1 hypothetical protein DDZ16_03105 [Marinilabilia rubra]
MVLFNLITGFLGSGKTTLLKNLLNELSKTKRIAIIQNEFAPTGIDGKELKQNHSDFKLVEINNGSVFCVCQLNNFVQQMQKLIHDYQPEIIFLEASGLADPISIIELLQIKELNKLVTLDKSICLVDAPNYFKGLKTLVRFKHQIMVADKIILNKMDIFSGKLNDIEDSVRGLNPYGEILQSQFARVNWEQLTLPELSKGLAAQKHLGKISEGLPDIKACVLRTHDKMKEPQLLNFIGELQLKCPRIKGFINLADGKIVSVHSVFDNYEIKVITDYTGPSELIAFGHDLTIVELRKRYREHIKILN